MKSKWAGLARVVIVFFILVLFLNCLALFVGIKRDMLYGARSTGLSTLNDYFDEGEYYKIYRSAVQNRFANDKLAVDASQYEAFERYYHAYILARAYEDGDNSEYLKVMEEEKSNISWKKILEVIDSLEAEMNN